ncbi:MAG: UDP-4-amino-4,6-dideoxy-N-acetyl-beta-L-altrosamine transaminase [Marinomonas sp.]
MAGFKMIPYGRQDISQADIDAVVDVLQSDFLTQGPKVPLFEAAIAEKTGAEHVVAVNSATSALHIACLALGLGPGDWLWTSPITFAASSNCGLYCGAQVDFVDIDPKTFNLDPKALEAKLVDAEIQGRLPKVVIPVAMCGQAADLKSIRTLADRFGFAILEDASHAIGASYMSKAVGCGLYADISVFSFHPVKIVTTAEGGAAATNNPHLAQKMELLRSHGITRDTDLMQGPSDGPWYYQQVDLGFNYRMTEVQAALGISQFDRLEEYVGKRAKIAEYYGSALAHLPLRLPQLADGVRSSWHLYVIQLQEASVRKQVFQSMRELGLGVNMHYIPVYRHPYYKALGFRPENFPYAEDYYARSISIPLYPQMGEHSEREVVAAVERVMQGI